MSLDPVIAQNAAMLNQLMEDVALQGQGMMERLVAHARQTLQSQADKVSDRHERDKLDQAVRQLYTLSPQLAANFPQTLRQGFADFLMDKPLAVAEAAPLKFNQLELMDERQVQEKVDTARGLQMAVMAVESELGEFNALICSVLGLKQVQADRNPIRPEIFVQALRKVLASSGADSAVSQRWGHAMSTELGQELRKLYRQLKDRLLAQGIEPAEFSVLRTPEGSGKAAEPARAAAAAQSSANDSASPTTDTAKLTIHQLRKLMAGELEGATAELAAQLVSKLDKLGNKPLESEQELETARAELRSSAKVQSQVLGQEVVNMIIANISADPRLLPSVQKVVSQLEPALLRLTLSDPRFFSDKRHPARVLLEEVVQRSFGFESEQAPGFRIFLEQVSQSAKDLGRLDIADAQPFAKELARLRSGWAQEDQYRQQKQESAKQALMRAEQRNLLAAEMGQIILGRPDIALIPDEVVAFTVGPWVQVMAHARMHPALDQSAQVDYLALVEDLFWSVRPDQARKNVPALIKLIPRLLAGLRQGLKQIEFPQNETEHFFDTLIALHERSLNPDKADASRFRRPPSAGQASRPVGLTGGGSPWLAPEEARDSGFMDDLDEGSGMEAPTDFAATEPMSMPMELMAESGVAAPDLVARLKVGDWVELFASGQWAQAKLTWATPQGTLFLFTGLQGRTHSMTRRLLDRMSQEQHLRIGQPVTVVDQALDSVARVAMRNSIFMDIQDESTR
jgi:hypothetical protein